MIDKEYTVNIFYQNLPQNSQLSLHYLQSKSHKEIFSASYVVPYIHYRSGSIICDINTSIQLSDENSGGAADLPTVESIITNNIEMNKNNLSTSLGNIDGDEAKSNIKAATGTVTTTRIILRHHMGFWYLLHMRKTSN